MCTHQVLQHQHHVDHLDGDIRAGAHSQAYICFGQRGRIIDLVSDEGKPSVLGFQFSHRIDLAFRRYLGDHFIHAKLVRNGFCRAAVVARDHRNLQSKLMPRGDRASGVVFLIGSTTATIAANRPRCIALSIK